MSGGTVQLRPLVAYVLLAALSALMMNGAFTDPRHVIEAGPEPETVSATVVGEVRLGHLLSPGPSPVAPSVSPTGQPALVVHPIAQGAANGPSSYPAPGPGRSPSSPSATPSAPTVSQPQPAKPGKAKAKGKNKGGDFTRVSGTDKPGTDKTTKGKHR